jgi:hypothetical protein
MAAVLGRIRRECRNQPEQRLGEAEAIADPHQPRDQQPAGAQRDQRAEEEGNYR